ncbi:CHAT domain-containing protein, partial [Streptosporangium becharense]
YERTGWGEVLDEAVEVGRLALAALAPGDPGRAVNLSELGLSLRLSYERTGWGEVLDEAVEVGRLALAALAPGDPGRAMNLSNLGLSLRLLYERTGRTEALDEAVGLHREAVAATPSGDPKRAVRLFSLGLALHALAERTGRDDMLDEALDVDREAAAATAGNPNRAFYLSGFGRNLCALFERTGQTEALDEAVVMYRAAVAASSETSHRAAYLSNLGNALRSSYERSGRAEALDEAVRAGREAVAAAPGEPDSPLYLSNLANALVLLFLRTGRTEVLDEAVGLHRRAVAAAPRRAEYGGLLSNLGNALRLRYEEGGQAGVLDEAVEAHRRAVAVTDAGHPGRAAFLCNLADTLRLLHERSGEPAVPAEIRAVLAEATEAAAAPVTVRIIAHHRRGKALMRAGDGAEALAAYEEAIALLPRLAPRRLRRADREHGLGEVAGLAADAAAAAIEVGRPERAVELLEQARGVLLGEAMAAHGDLTDLRVRAPELARRFTQLRDALDAADRPAPDPLSEDGPFGALTGSARGDGAGTGPRDVASGDGIVPGAIWQVAERRRSLAREWEELLARIRSMEGLERFMLPPSVDRLRRQAVDGPIIVVNISDHRCDALLLTADAGRPVRLVELPRLTRPIVIDQVNRFLAAVADAKGGELGRRPGAHGEMNAVLGWLWDEITGPILESPELAAAFEAGGGVRESEARAGLHESETVGGVHGSGAEAGAVGSEAGGGVRESGQAGIRPRVWWCPVGEAVFLPLHAAGRHVPAEDGNDDGGGRTGRPATALDRVVSSYTSTVRALAHARRGRTADLGGPAPEVTRGAAVVVAMPVTPDAPDLPGVRAEVGRLARLLPGSLLLTGAGATRDVLLEVLPLYRVAHLACHGLSDWEVPAGSRLLLHDHVTRPLTVTAISGLRLAHAELAYLSACSTTRVNQRLADEAVHITGAFQLAGYRQVIGTMWPVDDGSAADLAEDFYGRLTCGGARPPRTGDAAVALHWAVRALRERYAASPSLWAAYVHTGI